MSYSSFFDTHERIATIRLNNLERLNALTFQTYADQKVFAEMAHDGGVKVVVLTGTGKGFCSRGRIDEIIGPLLKMKGDELYRFTRMTCNVEKTARAKKSSAAVSKARPYRLPTSPLLPTESRARCIGEMRRSDASTSSGFSVILVTKA
jgi:enoyl-CoA hydratase/carnithine racemase